MRLPAGQSNIEGVWAKVDVTGPHDCATLVHGHSVKDLPFGPSLEDASASQIAQIHNALDAVFVFQPEAETIQGIRLNCFLEGRPQLPILTRARLSRDIEGPLSTRSKMNRLGGMKCGLQ